MLAVAADREVTTLVFCGDAFQHRKPDVDELHVFGRWIDDPDAPETLMLKGNHDDRGPGRRSVLELFGVAGDAFDGPDVFTRPGVKHLPEFDEGREGPDVVLCFLPWTHPGSLRAARGNPTPAEHAAALVEIAAALLAEARERDPVAVPILVTHYALDGMSLPSGIATSELVAEPVLPTHDLLALGFSYVFAGHVHKPDAVRDEVSGGWAVSVGSPAVRDFGEEHTKHGVWILDTATETLEHVELPGRRFVTIAVDVTSAPSSPADAESDVPRWIGDAEVEGAVVRVRIRATEGQAALIDLVAVRRQLLMLGAHKVYDVHLDVERTARARTEVLTDTEPLAALDAWLGSHAEPPREGQRLRDYLARLLREDVQR